MKYVLIYSFMISMFFGCGENCKPVDSSLISNNASQQAATEEADKLAKKAEEVRLTQEKSEQERLAKEEAEKLVFKKAEEDRLAIEEADKLAKQKEKIQSLIIQANDLYAKKTRLNMFKKEKEQIKIAQELIEKEQVNAKDLENTEQKLENIIQILQKSDYEVRRGKTLELLQGINNQQTEKEFFDLVTNAQVLGEELDQELDYIDNHTKGSVEGKLTAKLGMLLNYGNYSSFTIPEEIATKEQISLKLSEQASAMYDNSNKKSDKIYYLNLLNDANDITNYRIDNKNRQTLKNNLNEKRQDFFNTNINILSTQGSIKEMIALSQHVLISSADLREFKTIFAHNLQQAITQNNQQANKDIIDALVNTRSLINSPRNKSNTSSFIDTFSDDNLKKLLEESLDYDYDIKYLDKWLLEIIYYNKNLHKIISKDTLLKLINKFDLINKKVGFSEKNYYSIGNIIEKLSKNNQYQDYFSTDDGKKVLENSKNFNVIDV